MFKKIQDFIKNLDTSLISTERKEALTPIIRGLREEKKSSITLNFICTHNSRRSILSQVWMQVIACYYQKNNIQTFSGGTEKTQIYKSILSTLKNQGLKIDTLNESNNPIWILKYSETEQPIIGFSKKYSHSFNPQKDFIALMSCENANEDCPLVLGSKKKIPFSFTDPKFSDNTSEESIVYQQKSIEIATEIKYIIQKL